jgi:hypothetical protein
MDTAVASIDASSSAAGDITITELDSVTLISAKTVDGAISLVAGGELSAMTVTAGDAGGSGDDSITLTTTMDNLLFGILTTRDPNDPDAGANFDLTSAQDIVSLGAGNLIQGSTASRATLTATGDIGTQTGTIIFTGFNFENLPDGQEPIVLFFGTAAFINSNGAPVANFGGTLNNAATTAAAILGQSDAASREDSTDIDWAAYSTEIDLFAVNNEGVQLPEDMRLDDFVMLKRALDLEEQQRLTKRATARTEGDD